MDDFSLGVLGLFISVFSLVAIIFIPTIHEEESDK